MKTLNDVAEISELVQISENLRKLRWNHLSTLVPIVGYTASNDAFPLKLVELVPDNSREGSYLKLTEKGRRYEELGRQLQKLSDDFRQLATDLLNETV